MNRDGHEDRNRLKTKYYVEQFMRADFLLEHNIWRKVMVESAHGTGSANLNYGNKKGRVGNKKQKSTQNNISKKRFNKKQIWIVSIEVILCVITALAFKVTYQYADKNGCSGVFWDYISDCGIQILGGGFLDIFVSAIAAYVKEKKMVFWQFFIGIMAGILLFVCFFTFLKIKGAIEQEIVSFGNDKEAKDSVNSDESSQRIQKTVVEYKINQDLYMSERSLKDYYVGEISKGNEKNVRAEILLNNLEYNMPAGSRSENYTNLLETADSEYDTYMYQRNHDKGKSTENETLFLDRIEMLQKSLDKREEAHKEWENPSNERLLASGYRDMGDEYFSRGMQSDAIVAYEKSADWYIKAIYHAAAEKDYDEMKRCMEKFEKLGYEVEKLDEIDLDRKENIQKMIDVYKLFTDKINHSFLDPV